MAGIQSTKEENVTQTSSDRERGCVCVTFSCNRNLRGLSFINSGDTDQVHCDTAQEFPHRL